MTHAWRSIGDKRTIVFNYQPSPEIKEYLTTMQNAFRQALQIGYQLAISNSTNQIPSAIDIRFSCKCNNLIKNGFTTVL